MLPSNTIKKQSTITTEISLPLEPTRKQEALKQIPHLQQHHSPEVSHHEPATIRKNNIRY
jgi:hypothetical protein